MADPHDPPASEPGRTEAPDAPGPGASRRRSGKGSTRRRVDTRDPRRSRERALKILFQADVRGVAGSAVLARIVDDPRAWAMLDDLDPDEAAELAPTVDAADANADAEPQEVAREARRRKALELDGFTRSLVQGVADHQDELDDLIQRYARRWTVSRMPAIDRNVLRLGAYELAFETTSPAVVINEVIELAKRLSTEDSGRYVNGVLESIRKHLAATPLGAVEVEPTVPDAADPDARAPVPAPAPASEPDLVDLDDLASGEREPSEEAEPSGEPDPAEGQQQLF